MIALIDYDAGNIKSVEKAFQSLGKEAALTGSRKRMLSFHYETDKDQHNCCRSVSDLHRKK